MQFECLEAYYKAFICNQKLYDKQALRGKNLFEANK